MGDLLSFLYTVVDSLSLILFLDVFAERRWSDRKFTIGVGCFIALNFWILKVPLDLLSPQSGHKNRDDPFVLHVQCTGVVHQNLR